VAAPDRFYPNLGFYRPARFAAPAAPASPNPARTAQAGRCRHGHYHEEGCEFHTCELGDGCEVDVHDVLDDADYQIFVAERDGADHYVDDPTRDWRDE
jgi:hypothetical protein